MLKNLIKYIDESNPNILSGLLFVLLALYALVLMPYYPITCDTAEFLNNPLRVINGEMPYRDFWLLFSPGEVLFPSLIYKFLGTNIDTLRYVMILVSVANVLLFFRIFKQLSFKNSLSIFATLSVYLSSVIFTYEGPHYIHLFFTFLSFAALYIIKYIQASQLKYLIVAGLMIGIAVFFRVYEVGAAAFGMFLLIIALSAKSPKQKVNIVTYPFIAFLSIILLIFIALNDIWSVMINEVIFESVKNGTSMNLPYFWDSLLAFQSIKEDFTLIFAGKISTIIPLAYHILSFLYTAISYLMPAISIIMFGIIYKNISREEKFIISLLLLWAFMSFPKAIGRSDIAHLSPFLAPALMAVFYMFASMIKYNLALQLRKFVFLPILLISLFPIFKPAMEFIKAKQKGVEIASVANGNFRCESKQERIDSENLIKFVESNTKENEYIFYTLWDAPPFYALTNRRNPTFYDSLNDLLLRHSPEKQMKIIADLKAKKVKYIIHNANWGYDNKPEQQFRVACDVLQNFFDNECMLIKSFGFYEVYVMR